MKTQVKGDRLADGLGVRTTERGDGTCLPYCQKRVGPMLGARCNAFFAHHRSDCDAVRLELEKQ